MAGQFLFTAIDILMAAVVLYLLLPPNDLGFATFLAVFAAAIFAGVASRVPGGVGVFETVIIAAFPASVPVDQAAAGLLLYRLIYYLVPFALALVLLALSELRMASTKVQLPTTQALAPVFGAGRCAAGHVRDVFCIWRRHALVVADPVVKRSCR